MSLKWCGSKQSLPSLWYYPRTSMNELKKSMKNFSQDSQSLGWDFNSGSPEYKALVSTTQPSCFLSLHTANDCIITTITSKIKIHHQAAFQDWQSDQSKYKCYLWWGGTLPSFTTVSSITVHLVYGSTDKSYTANKMPLTSITNEIFNQWVQRRQRARQRPSGRRQTKRAEELIQAQEKSL